MSPLLFNLFVSTYLSNVQLHTSYADDAAESPVKPQIAVTALIAYAEALGHWAMERDLQISALKSHITFFTSNTPALPPSPIQLFSTTTHCY